MTKPRLLFLIITIILAGVGALVFYYRKSDTSRISDNSENDNSFIQTITQAPAVEGNVVNSGIAGRVILLGGGSYEYEASLDIFKSDNLSKPFISVRSDAKGNFQIPMRPGSYILKPVDPDGPIIPAKNSYQFVIGAGQWLQVRVEYNSSISE